MADTSRAIERGSTKQDALDTGGTTKTFEAARRSVEWVKNRLTDLKKTIENAGTGLWEGLVDKKQEDVNVLVGNCMQAGIVFKLEKRIDNPDGTPANPKYEIVAQPIDAQYDDRKGAKELVEDRNKLITTINSKLKTNPPERLNPMIAKAVLENLKDSFRNIKGDEARQLAELSTEIRIGTTYQRDIYKGDFKLTANKLAEAFGKQSGGAGAAPLTPEIQSFVNLYNGGEGLIDKDQHLDDVQKLLEKHINVSTSFYEADAKGGMRDFLETLPQKGIDNFFKLHPAEKMTILGLAIYALFFNKGMVNKVAKNTLLWGSLAWVGSRLFTGLNPFELIGVAGGGFHKFMKTLEEGEYSSEIQRVLQYEKGNKAGLQRLQGLLIVGSMRLDDVLNLYHPESGHVDMNKLTQDQKEVIQKLKNPSVNRDNAADFDPEKGISEALDMIFATISGRKTGNIRENAKEGYKIVREKYTGDKALAWNAATKETGGLRFFQVVTHYIDNDPKSPFTRFVEGAKDQATGESSEVKNILERQKQERMEAKDLSSATSWFDEAGIKLEREAVSDRANAFRTFSNTHRLGGWPVDVDVNNEVIRFYNNGTSLPIYVLDPDYSKIKNEDIEQWPIPYEYESTEKDPLTGKTEKVRVKTHLIALTRALPDRVRKLSLDTQKDAFRKDLKQRIEILAQTELSFQIPGLDAIQYDLQSGEYRANYTAADKGLWEITFVPVSYGFEVKEMHRKQPSTAKPGSFDAATGKIEIPSVDHTGAGETGGFPLTKDSLDFILGHSGNLKVIQQAIHGLPNYVTWQNFERQVNGSFKIKVSPSITVLGDKDLQQFQFEGDTGGKAITRDRLRDKIEEKVTVTETVNIFVERLKASGYKVEIEKDGSNNPVKLKLPDYEVSVPISSDEKDPTGLYVNPKTKLVETMYGKRVSYRAEEMEEKVILPALTRELLGADKGFTIYKAKGSKLWIRYDEGQDSYAPSYLTIDMQDLKWIGSDTGLTAEQKKNLDTQDKLPAKLEPLKDVLKVFAGYEIKNGTLKLERTMDKNNAQLGKMSMLIGSYEEKTALDRPKDRMLWQVEINLNLDEGKPNETKSVVVKQLDGNPRVETSEELTWEKLKASSIKKEIEKIREKRLSAYAKKYPDGFQYKEVDEMYEIFSHTGKDGARTWLQNKNELHALQNAGLEERITEKAQSLEQNWDQGVENITTDAAYEAIYSGFDEKYKRLFTNEAHTSTQTAVRYLLLKRYNDETATDFTTSYDEKNAKKLQQIHNITEERAKMFLKYPVLIDIYAALLDSQQDFGTDHITWSWMPEQVKDAVNRTNLPPFPEIMQDTAALVILMNQIQVTAEEQTKTQIELLEKVKTGDKKGIIALCAKYRKVYEKFAWYTEPTWLEKGMKWTGEQLEEATKHLKIDK